MVFGRFEVVARRDEALKRWPRAFVSFGPSWSSASIEGRDA